MFLDHREQIAQPGVLGAYVFIGLMGAHTESRHGVLIAAIAIAALAAIAWMLSLRRLFAMSGTPTSRIASAAQGYVELSGHGTSTPQFQVVSKLTALPCLWYRYRVEQKTSDNKWKRVASGRSEESFLLDDGSGQCLVDPEQAEVIPRSKETWTQGDYRYTEWLLLPRDAVYVLGQFSTLGGETAELDAKRDVSELLAEWKRNQAQLLERFDLDRDGTISEREWALARSQARREVRKTHNEIRTRPGTHIVHKPRDGRLFLISNIDPGKLARRYKVWAWVHLGFVLAAIGTIGWLAA
jgi:hypothetical protein